MREIKVNGEVRTAYFENIFPVWRPGIRKCVPGNLHIIRFVFGNEALNVQLEGACPDYDDIQEISGSPSGRGTYREQWDGFRNYLVLVQPARLESDRLKAWDGIAKIKAGLELKVVYWFTELEHGEIADVRIPRAHKQWMELNLKEEETRKELNRKEAEDRALALEREKAITEQEKEKTALIIAQTEAVKQPAAAAKQVIALNGKLARAEEASASTLKEALKKWMRFNPPGMGANTKARIEKAVHFYITDPDKRSLSKIAAEFHVSRTTVSKWFNIFTKETGHAVANHQRNESVRERTFVDTAGPTTAKKSHSGWYDPEGEGSHPR